MQRWKPGTRAWVNARVDMLAEMPRHERAQFAMMVTGHNPWGRTDWPRGRGGTFLPHTGYPRGLSAWMAHNERAR